MKRDKTVNIFFILSLIIGVVSCVSTDDIKMSIPDSKQSPSVNPLASLSPSTDFNWEMYNNKNATIVIADRYDNQYDYVLQIFDEQPILGISPIAVGVARGNSPLSISIDINQRGTQLYVRQIDPMGRIETFSFDKPITNSFTLRLFNDSSDQILVESVMTEEQEKKLEEINRKYAKLIASEQETYEESGTEYSVITRGEKKSSPSFIAPNRPNDLIKASTYPSTAKVNLLDSGYPFTDYTGDYVIKEGETQYLNGHFLYASRKHANIYVAGTLEIPYSLSLKNIDIYVLPTGKLTGRDLDLETSGKLYIAKEGIADLHNITKSYNAQVIVDGILTANELTGNSSNCLLYIGASGKVNVAKQIRGYFSYIYIDGNQSDGSGGVLSCENLALFSNRTNFVIKSHAQLKVSEMIYSASTLYNEGLVVTKDYDGGFIGEIYNTCTMAVSNELLDVYRLFMKDASLIGQQDKVNNELKPLSLATLYHSYFYLYDGSYIYIDRLKQQKLAVQGIITDTSKKSSLLRLNKCYNEKGKSSVTGAVKLWIPRQYQGSFKAKKGASIFNNAVDVPYDLDNCSGPVVEKNPAEPDEPEIIHGELKGHYTINFEDKWPQFGDYDLNDLVFHVETVKTEQTLDGYIQELSVKMQLLAVGATFHSALGLQLNALKGMDIQQVTVSSIGKVGAQVSDLGAMEINVAKGIEKANPTDPVVIPLIYDTHGFLTGLEQRKGVERKMLRSGENNISPRNITLHITFAANSKVDVSKLSLKNTNFFLYKPADPYALDGKRVEIHLRDYLPTINATNVYFGVANDASILATHKTYRSASNFPWGICVMDNTKTTTDAHGNPIAIKVPWKLSFEGQSINKAYPKFANWVNSGSDSETGWSTFN